LKGGTESGLSDTLVAVLVCRLHRVTSEPPSFGNSNLHTIHIVRQIALAILLARTCAIPQEPEAVLRVVSNVEVFAAHVLQALLEVEDRAGIYPGELTRFLAVLVPAAARVCPHGALEEFLSPGVVVFNGFFLDVDRPVTRMSQ